MADILGMASPGDGSLFVEFNSWENRRLTTGSSRGNQHQGNESIA
jgi:hypothetical protein